MSSSSAAPLLHQPNLRQVFGEQANIITGSNAIDQFERIKTHFSGLQGHTMPLNVRKIIQIHCSAFSRTQDHPLGDDRSMRVKALMTATFGSVFALATRVGRLAIFTLGLIPATVVRAATASRLGVDGAVSELWKKYGDEWTDLKFCLLAPFIAAAQIVQPQVGAGPIQNMLNYYIDRANRRAQHAERMSNAEATHAVQAAAAKDRVRAAQAGNP